MNVVAHNPEEELPTLLALAKTVSITAVLLSAVSGIHPSTISRLKTEGLNEAQTGKLLDGIARILNAALEFKKGVGLDLINENSGYIFTQEQLARISRKSNPAQLNDIADQVLALKLIFSGEVPKFVAKAEASAPRGVLGANAPNYVDRIDDEAILRNISETNDPVTIVSAPIHGGVSSFFARLAKLVRQREGYHYLGVDFEEFADSFEADETPTRLDVLALLYRALGTPKPDLVGDQHDLKEAFVEHAVAAWSNHKRVVISIDGLDALFLRFPDGNSPVNSILAWLGSMRSTIARGDQPFDRVIIYCGYTGLTLTAAYESPVTGQSKDQQLMKFEPSQVNDLLAYFIERNDSLGLKIYEYTHGHPFLAHNLCYFAKESQEFGEILARLEQEAGRGAWHWKRILSEIEAALPKFNVNEVLWLAKKAAEGSLETSKTWLEARPVLKRLGLTDGALRNPSICPFYIKKIEQELENTSYE